MGASLYSLSHFPAVDSKQISKYVNYGEEFDFNNTEIKLPYTISTDSEFYKIKIYFPEFAINKEHYSWDDPIGSFPQILNDLNNKFSGIENPVIESKYLLTGELDSRFKSNSIYGNLERLLGKYQRKKMKLVKMI